MKTRICGTCEQEKPEAEFFVYNSHRDECRKCRAWRVNRESRKRTRREKWKRECYIEDQARMENRRVDKEAIRADVMIEHLRLKVVTTQYKNEVRVTKRRIREMEANPNPTLKTEKALRTRYDLLKRYTAAFEKQKADIARGIRPPDLREYLANGWV